MGIRSKVVIAAGAAAAKKGKEVFDDRGGTDGLKSDLAKVKDASTTPGPLGDKARALIAALKRPGTSEKTEGDETSVPIDRSERGDDRDTGEETPPHGEKFVNEAT